MRRKHSEFSYSELSDPSDVLLRQVPEEEEDEEEEDDDKDENDDDEEQGDGYSETLVRVPARAELVTAQAWGLV